MIAIAENVNDGDLVYAWVSPFNEKSKSSKKDLEHEYRFSRPIKGAFKLASLDGKSWCIFTEDLIATWNGNVRKV